ncbi:MAG: PLP-dependent aminotransferase family protein [Hyphomicrobiales bacterium]
MRDSLFHVERMEATTLQAQIREMLVTAMLSGQLPALSPIPSTRAMAKRLKVSRNTVMLAYQALAADGYLTARERSGFYVSEEIQAGIVASNTSDFPAKVEVENPIDWSQKLRLHPTEQANITKPKNWHDYPYPFIYGQSDPALFPITAWRDCTRQAMNRKWLDAWTDDRFNEDDPRLVEQIRQRILTRRGIMAAPDEILVTLGAQNALYLLASLLVKSKTSVSIEDPGYPDMRNIFTLMSEDVRPVPVDNEGIQIPPLDGSDLVFVTPSHQFPTNVTMSMARRRELLKWADSNDALIIEDDYEFETNYIGEPTPALKSLDASGRVLYIGSLSKSIMPGLRMGYLVGSADLIAEVRALRRLMLRHPPGNNQRIVALFLSLGRHDALIGRLHRAYSERWKTLGVSLENHFPGWFQTPGFGGTSFWVKGPDGMDARHLAAKALEEGVVIEPGNVHFADPDGPKQFFRLGFSSIPNERIEPGIVKLADVASRL